MVKKKIRKKQYTNILLSLIIVILFLSNIYMYYLFNNRNNEITIREEVLFTETNKDYNKKEKYYVNINYNKFQKLLKEDEITTIAIIDNSSNTYDKFIEMINQIAYYKNTKIYLLETSKLSKKDEIKFYEVDERLIQLDTNYIITLSKNKIISITTFDNTKIHTIIEGLGE